jgi:hypothetical protein
MKLSEPLRDVFTSSKVITLDFDHIAEDIPDYENIQLFFEQTIRNGLNPRLPEQRQAFNDRLLQRSGYKYLIGQYGEDRKSMLADTRAGKDGRTIHMAIDIFSSQLDPVYSPCDGNIVRSDCEEGFGEFGNYLIIEPAERNPENNLYIFLGHLSVDKAPVGPVDEGQHIANLGDYIGNENGGWSRHTHLQILKILPEEGFAPDGYVTRDDFARAQEIFPNPLEYFEGWQIDS